MDYDAIIIDSLSEMAQKAIPFLNILARNGRLIINKHSVFSSLFKGSLIYDTPENLISEIDNKISRDFDLDPPSDDIRFRHIVKENDHYYIIFNEDSDNVLTKIKIAPKGKRQLINPATAEAVDLDVDEMVSFKPHDLIIIRVKQ